MINCKDCFYWNRTDTTCTLPEWVDERDEIINDTLAMIANASDDQGLYVKLKTGPDFGCIRAKCK